MDHSDHDRRVAEFKADLAQMDLIGVVRKHITTGRSAALDDGAYYDLRNEVADHFRLHPSAVVVVGSCRTGFSLKPNKRFAKFTDASDVDLAIISTTKFEVFWDLAFDHWRARRLWPNRGTYNRFLKELFRGWLWPRRLPSDREFAEALAWVEFEDKLCRTRFHGLRSVGARLYRSWDRLEAYQAIHVLKCKNALTKGNL